MGKLNKIFLFMGIILLFFHFAGLIPDSPARILLHFLLNPETIKVSALIASMDSVIASLFAAGLAVGFLVSGRTEAALRAGLCVVFIEIFYGWIVIIEKLVEVNEALGIIFGAPILFYAVIAAFDWLFGKD